MRPLQEIFEIDLRSMAFFRIALGFLILGEIADRLMNLSAFYSDSGILPRAALLEKFSNVWYVSLHHASGMVGWQIFLFAIEAIAAICMIVGFQTRTATWIAWVLQISVQARNPIILQGGDVLFRLLIMWGGFMPLGARWSFDAVLSPKRAEAAPNRLVTVATIAYYFQILFVYWFAILQKTGREWLPEGSAVYYALNIDLLATHLGVWLRQFPEFMRLSSIGTFLAEALLPFLLISPIFTGPLRLLGVAAIIGMHTAFGLCLELGNFPWIDAVSVLLFVPTEAWDWLERRIERSGEGSWWRRGLVKTASLRSAVLRVATRAWAELPPRMTRAIRVTPTFFGQGLALLLFVTAFVWNLSTVPKLGVEVPAAARVIGQMFRVDQQWAMFSPFPMKDDGWYVIEGQIKDRNEPKATIDVLHNRLTSPSFDKPALGSAEWSNQRWRKYAMNLWSASNSQHRLYYARWLCLTWNKRHPATEQLDEFTIYYMREDTLPDRIAKPEKVSIWHHYCFK